MNRASRIGILCVSVAIFCYAGIGHVLGRTPDDKAYKSLTVYGEVLQKVQQDYVDDPNMRTVTAGSLHGMLESLDSQSSYLTPREYDEYKKKLTNTGTANVNFLSFAISGPFAIALNACPVALTPGSGSSPGPGGSRAVLGQGPPDGVRGGRAPRATEWQDNTRWPATAPDSIV